MCSFVRKITKKNKATGKDVKSTLKCLNALEMTMIGTIMLWKSISLQSDFYVLPVPNQDPLENVFGCIIDNRTPIHKSF